MLTNSVRKPLTILARDLRVPLIPIVGYILVISWLDIQFHLEDYNFPVTVVAVMGTVIGLVLAFRTNSSYCRWWEARILWGAIVNDSRSWSRQILQFIASDPANEKVIRRLTFRQIAWCHALARSLRGQNPIQDVGAFLDADEIQTYGAINNIPNEMLLRQGRELKMLHEAGQIELFQWIELEATLSRLTNSMGGCERIKNTPFPMLYNRIVDNLIYVFVFFLPFGLVNVPAAALIVTSLVLSISFLMIEHTALRMESPFHDFPTDTPMLSLSRTIEINLKQMLAEAEIPEKLEPVDGILM